MVVALSVRLRGAFNVEERFEDVSYGPPLVGPDARGEPPLELLRAGARHLQGNEAAWRVADDHAAAVGGVWLALD